MALSVTINLDDTREAELNKRRDEYNRLFPNNQLTATQVARDILRDNLDASAQARVDETERLRIKQAYNAATIEDQERVRRILKL